MKEADLGVSGIVGRCDSWFKQDGVQCSRTFKTKPKTMVGRPSSRNSHCQPRRPRNPFSDSSAAAIGAPATCINMLLLGSVYAAAVSSKTNAQHSCNINSDAQRHCNRAGHTAEKLCEAEVFLLYFAQKQGKCAPE